MLSKNKIKYLSSLSEKKGRMESSAFLVEGEKMVLEALDSRFEVKTIFLTAKTYNNLSGTINEKIEVIEISESDSSRISTQKTPQGIFAEVAIPAGFYSSNIDKIDRLTVALYNIQDPGNLGTIIRTADWMGTEQIICSKATVDVLNPKVLQSTMGAAFRMKLHYVDLTETLINLKQKQKDLPILAALLNGESIYQDNTPVNGILMMGNESKGLPEELIQLATHKITIPRYGNSSNSTESLNVSVATAIILSELKRKAIAFR